VKGGEWRDVHTQKPRNAAIQHPDKNYMTFASSQPAFKVIEHFWEGKDNCGMKNT